MSGPEKSTVPLASNLCLACGLCCNGVIFAHVQLQPEDDAARLEGLGLGISNVKGSKKVSRFTQPCAAFQGCQCRIYSERPKHCREFECVLLKSVIAGHTSNEVALQIIKSARTGAEKVFKLLRTLGDNDEAAPLAARFRRMKKKLESEPLDEESAEVFGTLTLAVHDLNLMLSEAFYPGDGQGCFER